MECCDSMKANLVNDSDLQEGFSVYINERGRYFISFNVIKTAKLDMLIGKLKQINLRDLNDNLKLGGELGIRFCPWCGTNLLSQNEEKLN